MDSNGLLILTMVALAIIIVLYKIVLADPLASESSLVSSQGELTDFLHTPGSYGQRKFFSAQDQSSDSRRRTGEEQGSEPASAAGSKNVRDLNVLLVEDNAINQKILLMSLKNKVKRITVTNNGKEALDMFGREKYDLVLMDIQMPVMDGITATKKIREVESSTEHRVPIIAITANALTVDRDLCLKAGANDYLSKPYQMEELLRRIEALL